MKSFGARTRLVAAIGLAALVTMLVTGPAGAATKNVTIVNLSFGPPVTINMGDTVNWTNGEASGSGIPHTVTSDTSAWASSGFLTPGQSFSHTFTATGSFAYHCMVHPSMHGIVTVNAVTTTTAPRATTTTTAPSSTATTTVTTTPATSTATTAAPAVAPLATTGPGHVALLVELAAGLLLAGLFTMVMARRRRLQD